MALPYTSRRSRSTADIEEQLRSELDILRPLLGIDHCAIELYRFEPADGVALLRIDASCPDCDLSGATFIPGIETHLKLRVAELREVRVHTAGDR